MGLRPGEVGKSRLERPSSTESLLLASRVTTNLAQSLPSSHTGTDQTGLCKAGTRLMWSWSQVSRGTHSALTLFGKIKRKTNHTSEASSLALTGTSTPSNGPPITLLGSLTAIRLAEQSINLTSPSLTKNRS